MTSTLGRPIAVAAALLLVLSACGGSGAITTTTASPVPATGDVGAAAWDAGLTNDDAGALLDAVDAYFADASLDATIDPDGGVVTVSGLEDIQFNLGAIAEAYVAAGGEQPGTVVADHFDRVLGALVDAAQPLASFRDSAPSLRVRLYPQGVFAGIQGSEALRRQVAQGIFLTVVYDTRDAIRILRADDIAEWSATEDEVFAAATANTLDEPLTPVEGELGEGGPVVLTLANSFYTSAFVVELDRFIEGDASAGVLVIMPVGDLAMIYVIAGPEAADAVEALAAFANSLLAEGPDPLSPFVYWWQDGTLRELASYVPEEGQAVYVADVGDEFLNLVAQLGSG